MTTLEKGKNRGDLVLSAYSQQLCFESAVIYNQLGSNVTDFAILGQPVKETSTGWEFVEDGDEANAEGLVVDRATYDIVDTEATPIQHAIIVRGPAVLNKDAIAATDINGDALDADAIVLAIEALGDIVFRSEPVTSETQTS